MGEGGGIVVCGLGFGVWGLGFRFDGLVFKSCIHVTHLTQQLHRLHVAPILRNCSNKTRLGSLVLPLTSPGQCVLDKVFNGCV